jgi:hypothetical protein
MPFAQAVVENGVLTLGGTNAISITDVDAANGLLEITLTRDRRDADAILARGADFHERRWRG